MNITAIPQLIVILDDALYMYSTWYSVLIDFQTSEPKSSHLLTDFRILHAIMDDQHQGPNEDNNIMVVTQEALLENESQIIMKNQKWNRSSWTLLRVLLARLTWSLEGIHCGQIGKQVMTGIETERNPRRIRGIWNLLTAMTDARRIHRKWVEPCAHVWPCGHWQLTSNCPWIKVDLLAAWYSTKPDPRWNELRWAALG